jgi:hypothetical protein
MSSIKVTSLAIAASLLAGSAYAADLIVVDPVVDMASPKVYDAYIGIIGTAGGTTNVGPFGGVGVVIGVDVDVTDVVYIGADLRGTGYFDGGGYTGFEILGLGRLGFHATEGVDFYLTGGVGHFASVGPNSNTYYTVGVGADFDIAESLVLRTEITASGGFGVAPDTAQGTVGLLWSF